MQTKRTFSKISQEDRAELIKIIPEFLKNLETHGLLSGDEEHKLMLLINEELREPFLTAGSALVSLILHSVGLI